MCLTHSCVAGSLSSAKETRREKMSPKKDEGASQTNELICPPMTLAQQVKGTVYLARLTIEVCRLFIEIIKLIKPYQSVRNRPVTEIADGLGDDPGGMERKLVE